MSLTDLQRAAARPYRFESTLRRSRLANRQPDHLRAITSENQHVDVLYAKIIPGGRYLVTAGQTRWTARDGPYQEFQPKKMVTVWDICPPGDRSISQVAEFKLSGEEERDDILHLSIESIGVRLDDRRGRKAVLIVVRSVIGNGM